MPAPKGQKAATKPGRRVAARQASGTTTQLDDLPDSVLGLILSLAGDTCGPNISAVSRRWRRVCYSEPAVWREFVLRPVPPPEAALRLDAFDEEVQPANDEEPAEWDSEAEAEAARGWWASASPEQVVAAFAARRRQLRQTAHLVTHAQLEYAHSLFRGQAERRGGWKLRQVLQALPAGLEGLTLETWMESISKREEAALLAATSAALSRFRSLTALQLRVQVLPKAAAAALARLTGLSHLRLEVEQLGEDVGGSCLALSRLTSLTLRPRRGLLPARRLLELPQRLPLLVQLELSELWLAEDRLADLELLAPADFPHLRTYSFGFELCRRRLQVDGVQLAMCSYREERQAGGGLPNWRRRMHALDSCGGVVEPPSGPLQGRLKLYGAALPAGSTLQQLLQRLLPPRGISLGALELEECRFTPAQCGDCPLLQGLNELSVKSPHFLPDSHTAEEAEEDYFAHGQRQPPPDGSPADLARKAAVEPVLAALIAQMPRLERLELAVPLPQGGGLPDCIVQRTGLRFLDLDGSYFLEQLPAGPYLQSLETLLLDDQSFERLPRTLAAATRCRHLSMNLCFDMVITKKDVDDVLVKMVALRELHLNNDESWNPYSYPLPLLRYMSERLPGVRIVVMSGSSGLSDFDYIDLDWEGGSDWDSEGGSGWDSEGGSSEGERSEDDSSGDSEEGGGGGWGGNYLGSEEEEEEEEQQQQSAGGGGSAGASGSRQPRAKAKPAGKGRPAAKARMAAGAGKGKGKQPAKGKAAAAAKPAAKSKGKGAQGKDKGKQQKQRPVRKHKGGK